MRLAREGSVRQQISTTRVKRATGCHAGDGAQWDVLHPDASLAPPLSSERLARHDVSSDIRMLRVTRV